MFLFLARIFGIGGAIGALIAVGSIALDGRRDPERFRLSRFAKAGAIGGAFGGGIPGAILGFAPHAPWSLIVAIGVGVGSVTGSILAFGVGMLRSRYAARRVPAL